MNNSSIDQRILKAAQWRYATKVFDAKRKIPVEAWGVLEQTLVLSPSSFGLQPWRFLVVENPALRMQLREASWNQAQVTDASHYVVMAARDAVEPRDAERLARRIAEVRGVEMDTLSGYRQIIEGFLQAPPAGFDLGSWSKRQVYIALGNFMTAAALMGIDTCPMEGFSPDAYNRLLKLEEGDYHAVVAVAAGYRSAEDKYAGQTKARYAHKDVVEHII